MKTISTKFTTLNKYTNFFFLHAFYQLSWSFLWLCFHFFFYLWFECQIIYVVIFSSYYFLWFFLIIYVYIMFDIKQHQLKQQQNKSSFYFAFFVMNYSLFYVCSYYSFAFLFVWNNFSYDFTFPFFIVLMEKAATTTTHTHTKYKWRNTLGNLFQSFQFFAFILFHCYFVLPCLLHVSFVFFTTKTKHRRRKVENYSNGLIDIIFFLIYLLLCILLYYFTLYLYKKKLWRMSNKNF